VLLDVLVLPELEDALEDEEEEDEEEEEPEDEDLPDEPPLSARADVALRASNGVGRAGGYESRADEGHGRDSFEVVKFSQCV